MCRAGGRPGSSSSLYSSLMSPVSCGSSKSAVCNTNTRPERNHSVYTCIGNCSPAQPHTTTHNDTSCNPSKDSNGTRQPTHCTSAPTSLARSFSPPSANACAAAQIGCKCAAAPVQATGISGQQLCKRRNTEPVVPLGRRYHPSWPYPPRRRDHGVPVGAGGGARAKPLPVHKGGAENESNQFKLATLSQRTAPGSGFRLQLQHSVCCMKLNRELTCWVSGATRFRPSPSLSTIVSFDFSS